MELKGIESNFRNNIKTCKKCGKYPIIMRGDVNFDESNLTLSFAELFWCPDCKIKLKSNTRIKVSGNGMLAIRNGYKELIQEWNKMQELS